VKGYAIDLSAQLDSLGLICASFDHAIEDAREPVRVRWLNNRYGATATKYKEAF
jgi:hypothetical protein